MENLPLIGHKQTTQWKIFTIFKISAHLDKAIIKPSCWEVSHQKFFLLGDYHLTDRCAKKVGFPKYGHIIYVCVCCTIQYHYYGVVLCIEATVGKTNF